MSEKDLKHVATDIPEELRDRMNRVIEEHGLTIRGFMRQAILKRVLHYEKSMMHRKQKESVDVQGNRPYQDG